jgi:UDP-2,3-diacylglucosamine pyrophosphatase LpxH
MKLAFDLISDLHLDTWPAKFDWTYRATAPYCIVAGDVARDRALLLRTLRHLSQCYQAVFYIDGNEEHSMYWNRINHSYQRLAQKISQIENIVYLQNNVVVINGVAILAANGWWGFDFDSVQEPGTVIEWYKDRWQNAVQRDPAYPTAVSDKDISWIINAAVRDARYMVQSVRKLQISGDVNHIVVVTHTVPLPELIDHDLQLHGQPRFNTMGNAYMREVLDEDIEKKIHTWCFGHYHLGVDRIINGVRYVNNCQGRDNTPWQKYVYNPLRLEFDQ